MYAVLGIYMHILGTVYIPSFFPSFPFPFCPLRCPRSGVRVGMVIYIYMYSIYSTLCCACSVCGRGGGALSICLYIHPWAGGYVVDYRQARTSSACPYPTPSHSITIRYHTIPYHTIPYHTIPYHTIPPFLLPAMYSIYLPTASTEAQKKKKKSPCRGWLAGWLAG